MSIICAFLPAVLLLVGGCAKFPTGSTSTVVRGLSFQITFAGPVNDNDYYYAVIDTAGGGTGPLPVFPATEGSVADDWITGTATHFVQYHQGQYIIYRIDHLNPLQYTPIGTPVRYTIPESGSNMLSFTIDLDAIGATNSTLNVNMIALNQLNPEGRLLDALGPLGGNFVNIDISSSRTFRNADASRPENSDDILTQNGISQPATDQTKSIDIVDWTMTTSL